MLFDSNILREKAVRRLELCECKVVVKVCGKKFGSYSIDKKKNEEKNRYTQKKKNTVIFLKYVTVPKLLIVDKQ